MTLDPIKQTLYECGMILGIIVVGIILILSFQYYTHYKTKNKNKPISFLWLTPTPKKIMVVVFFGMVIFIQLFMQNIRKVDDQSLRKEYESVYDYSTRKWVSTGYTFLFYFTYVLTLPLTWRSPLPP